MKWLVAALGVLLALLVAAAAALGWLVGTESGLHWAAGQVSNLQVEGLHGRLAGEITADKLAYESPEVRIAAQKLALRAHLAALLGGRLTIEPLRAAALEIELQEKEKPAGPAPRLPALRIHLSKATIDRLEVRRGGTRYLLQELAIDHASLGPGISAAASFFWPDERFATRGKLDLRGTLERIEAHLVADVSGVAAEARALIAPSAPQALQALEARAGPIDLARFDAAAPQTALTAALKAEPAGGNALGGTLSLANSLAGPIDAGRLPFSRLETEFVTDFTAARLRRLHVALSGGGTVQGDAALQPGRQGVDLHAKLVAAAVDLRSIYSTLRQTALSGPLEVLVEGERQWARGSLTQEGIGLTAEVLRTGERIEVKELRALVEGGEVSGTGQIQLGREKPFQAKIAVTDFNPAALGDYPAGSISGSAIASGTLEPRDIDLKWNLRDSTLYEHTFQSEGSARLVGERITQADGDLRLGANRLTARGAYGRPGDELAVTLDAPRLEEFAPIAGSVRARGTLTGSLENPRASVSAQADALTLPGGVQLRSLTAKGSGSLKAHDLELAAQAPDFALEVSAVLRGGWTGPRGWIGEIRALRNVGAYPLELTAPAALRIAPSRIELGRLEARLAEGTLLVREAAWSPARIVSSGEFAGLPAQWLIVAAGLSERLSATLLVDGQWQLTYADKTQGFVRVQRAQGDLALVGDGLIELGLERASLEARFSDGRAFAQVEAVSRLARVALQGEVVPALALQGKVEFAELGKLTRPLLEEVRIDGRLAAELRASGTLAKPLVHGTLAGEALAFDMPLYGIALKDGTLKAVLEGDSLKLESLSLRGGDGRLSASGTLPLGLDGTARIAWRAEKLTLLDRPDMRLVTSGEGEASYDGKRVALKGDLRADRGHFEFERERLPKLGEDVVVLGRPARPVKGKPKLPLELDLRLDLGSELVVRGYGYDGKVTGLVDLSTNKEGELRAHGRVTAVHATFLAYGQRLDVDPGVLIFDGPIDNPSLQVTAWRRNQAVEAGVQVTGTVRAPSVQLVSQPPVPEGERLSWLVLGRPPSGATQADLGLLQAAAGALLAGGESTPLDRRIARRFGLDEISLRGTGELTDRVVAVGKRLSDRLYISYEQGIGAVTSNLIKLDYALGRRWTLRAETGTSSGGGLFYRYSWD